MKVYLVLLAALLLARPVCAQTLIDGGNRLNVTGDAAINVTPDRVRLFLGVESRHKDLLTAKAENDAAVRKVIAALRALNVASSDVQTDYLQVNMSYVSGNGTLVDYYMVTKDVQVLLKDVRQFEDALSQTLLAGANHIYDVEFSTSELRKHRDAARALAMKAAQEKANDLAAAAGMKVVSAPMAISAYNYGGGASYGRGRLHGNRGIAQNTYQNAVTGDSVGADGTVALGTISVTASVSMAFQLGR